MSYAGPANLGSLEPQTFHLHTKQAQVARLIYRAYHHNVAIHAQELIARTLITQQSLSLPEIQPHPCSRCHNVLHSIRSLQ